MELKSISKDRRTDALINGDLDLVGKVQTRVCINSLFSWSLLAMHAAYLSPFKVIRAKVSSNHYFFKTSLESEESIESIKENDESLESIHQKEEEEESWVHQEMR